MIERELPVVTLLTVVKAGGEFALVEVRMQGDAVLTREVLEQGRNFRVVWDEYRKASALHFGQEMKQ